jgi:hypothetical protein
MMDCWQACGGPSFDSVGPGYWEGMGAGRGGVLGLLLCVLLLGAARAFLGPVKARGQAPLPLRFSTGTMVLVERDRGGEFLAVVKGKDGKRNLLVENAGGTVATVLPREVKFALEGTQYSPADINAFEEEARGLGEEEDVMLLELAWEHILQSDGSTGNVLSPSDLARLMFDHEGPVATFRAYRLLESRWGQIFFKLGKSGNRSGYKAKAAMLVEAARVEATREDKKRREVESFFKQLASTIAEQPGAIDWNTLPPRFEVCVIRARGQPEG